MKAAPPKRAFLLVILVLVLLSVPAVRAADDSNSQNLSQSPTLNPQQVASALQSLGNGLNDPNLQQLLNKFQNQIKAGDFNGASSTLLQLKSASANDPNASVALNSLLQSLTVGPNGLTINSNLLASLLGTNNPGSNGVPGNMQNENPAQVSVDLNTLANLLKYVDPTLANSLLDGASGAALGTSDSSSPSNYQASPFSLPGLPTIRPPSLSSPITGSLPGLSPVDIAVPLAVVGAVIAFLFYRSRVRGLPLVPGFAGAVRQEEAEEQLDPSKPRDRVILSFRRVVALMKGKGIPRGRSETHREFSAKCAVTPEGTHVAVVSSLYEKARFSGKEIAGPEASLAEDEASALERTS